MTSLKLLGLSATLILAGCAGDLDRRVTATRGAQVFAENCAVCHGADARGAIGPDLTLIAERNGGTFPEIETMATIYGPAYHQSRGTIMPEFGAGDLGPLVNVELEAGVGTPVPADLVALSEYLQSIQR
jgi:mono/diheme cytochrome c family protein